MQIVTNTDTIAWQTFSLQANLSK